MTQQEIQNDNGLGVASLVLGILSLVGGSILTGIPAIVTGFMALKNPASKGMGIAGIIMGGISTLITILVFIGIILLVMMGAFAASQYEGPTEGYNHNPGSSSVERRI